MLPRQIQLEVLANQALPDGTANRKKGTNRHQKEDDLKLVMQYMLIISRINRSRKELYPNDNKVEQAIHASALELRLSGVLHQLGVHSGEDHHAIAPLRVPEDAAPQQDLLVVQGESLAPPNQGAIELVQQVVGPLANDLAIEVP